MGQINSTTNARRKSNSPVRDNSSNVQGSVNNEATREVVEGGATPGLHAACQEKASEKRSRRESVRRSVLGMIGSNSSRHVSDVQGGVTKPEDKKRWRLSRRWSKTPAGARSETVNAASKALSMPHEADIESSESRNEIRDSDQAQEVGKIVELDNDSERQRSQPLSTDNKEKNSGGLGPLPVDATLSNDSIPVSPIKEQDEKPAEPSTSTGELSRIDEENRITTEVDESFRAPGIIDDRQNVPGPPMVLIEGTPMTSTEAEANRTEGASNSQASSSSHTQPDTRPSQERALRHFSPGGTLVVVQGVVHTTESPGVPPAESATPTSSDPLRTTSESTSVLRPRYQRNGLLPNFLNHRDSGTSIRSHGSTVESSAASSYAQDVSTAESSESSSGAASEATNSGSSSLDTASSSIPLTSNTENQETPHRPQLNSNSVDVLGALLSVATAATAASLLSASPQRDRSLQRSTTSQPTQQSTAGAMSPQILSPGGQATSPIPALARALAAANPMAAAAIAQREREREREETERSRVRSLWENIRERILHGRRIQDGTLPYRQTGLDAARGIDNSVIPDSLFSTLARAFNLDQTQDGRHASTGSTRRQESGQETSSTAREGQRSQDQDSAPPGSFERFLVDLQIDLRTILSESESGVSSSARTEATATTTSAEDSSNSTLPVSVGPSNVVRSVEQTDHSNDTVPLPSSADGHSPRIAAASADSAESSASDTRMTADIDHETSTQTDGVDALVASTSASIASNASDVLATNSLLFSDSGGVTNSVPLQPHSGTTVTQNAGQHTNVTAGSVNWWRMYRFPPMRMNQTRHNLPIPTASTSNARTSSAPTHPTEPITYHSALPPEDPLPTMATPPESSQFSSSPSESDRIVPLQTGQAADGNLVVPVIVVGLQSINGSRSNRPAEETQPPLAGSTSRPNTDQNALDNTPVHGEGNPQVENTEAQRGRNWHGRAARMLNRMGRRGGSSDTGGNGQTTSSRTFFIYVIGGYYPPDHQIVTGSDYFDSFEALLWELADLLGQVKPPVATDEEIQGSGLEVIRASSLPEYESANKVAGNCVERCLICLDDYEPENDIRLMSCKHAFHKSCVDHWLTTGRNNCPACRGMGVKTGDDRPLHRSETSS